MIKKIVIGVFIIVSAMAQVPFSQAAEVEIKWSNIDNYTDIEAGEENRKYFKEWVSKSIGKHIDKLANSLPSDQKLIIEVLNVDLAGTVKFKDSKQVRIIKEAFPPELELQYKLVNSENSVIKEEKILLRNLKFLQSVSTKYRSQSLGYEKEMLDDWFKETFIE